MYEQLLHVESIFTRDSHTKTPWLLSKTQPSISEIDVMQFINRQHLCFKLYNTANQKQKSKTQKFISLVRFTHIAVIN